MATGCSPKRRMPTRDDQPLHTIASYRDTICLLLRFAHRHVGKAPHQLDLVDLDAPLIGAFLNHLETERGVSARTRNTRLTAIRSLFGYAAYRHPEHAAVIQRVLAIPPKRTNRALVTYLTEAEMDALLAAPDRATRIGRRDHMLLLLALETGLRVSELTALTEPCCGPGSPNATAPRTTRSSPARQVHRSAATPSAASSTVMSQPPHTPAHQWRQRTSRPTPSGTAAR